MLRLVGPIIRDKRQRFTQIIWDKTVTVRETQLKQRLFLTSTEEEAIFSEPYLKLCLISYMTRRLSCLAFPGPGRKKLLEHETAATFFLFHRLGLPDHYNSQQETNALCIYVYIHVPHIAWQPSYMYLSLTHSQIGGREYTLRWLACRCLYRTLPTCMLKLIRCPTRRISHISVDQHLLLSSINAVR